MFGYYVAVKGSRNWIKKRGDFQRQKTGHWRYLWSTKIAEQVRALFSLWNNRGSGPASDVSIIHSGTSSFYGPGISEQGVKRMSWYVVTCMIFFWGGGGRNSLWETGRSHKIMRDWCAVTAGSETVMNQDFQGNCHYPTCHGAIRNVRLRV